MEKTAGAGIHEGCKCKTDSRKALNQVLYTEEKDVSRETAVRVLRTEAEAVLGIIGHIGPEFDRAEELIAGAQGRIIVSGMGKSGIIARKIAATFSSIGIPAYFLHPVEGAHGDIGTVMRGDVAVIVSKSGATEELTVLLNHLKRLGIPIVALTGNTSSSLAGAADIVLDVSVACEACLINAIPTASTTAALAMGDALAVSLFERKGLSEEDFAALHPGGTIGRKLTCRVRDLMITGSDLPLVDIEAPMKEVLEIMSEKKLGIGVITEDSKLAGVITDGDLRRLLQRVERPLEINARAALAHSGRDKAPRSKPLTIDPDAYAARAVSVMEKHIVTSLIIVDEHDAPIGLVRWIDLSLAGVV
ncbi:KpsF/GutQ family sugar-phosphate isomerase [bacterium]|nr:KpsF/GutQ family sugar-phosphate isomerase [bacterium]